MWERSLLAAACWILQRPARQVKIRPAARAEFARPRDGRALVSAESCGGRRKHSRSTIRTPLAVWFVPPTGDRGRREWVAGETTKGAEGGCSGSLCHRPPARYIR